MNWVVGVGSTRSDVKRRGFSWLLILEARAGGARFVRITGERRAESVSNRLELYALCGGKQEELYSGPRCSPNLSD